MPNVNDEVQYLYLDGEESKLLNAVVEEVFADGSVLLLVDMGRKNGEKFRVNAAVEANGRFENGMVPEAAVLKMKQPDVEIEEVQEQPVQQPDEAK